MDFIRVEPIEEILYNAPINKTLLQFLQDEDTINAFFIDAQWAKHDIKKLQWYCEPFMEKGNMMW